MHFNQQSWSSFFHTSSHRDTRARTIAIVIMFAITVVLTQSAQIQNFRAGGGSTPLPSRNATRRAHAFPS